MPSARVFPRSSPPSLPHSAIPFRPPLAPLPWQRCLYRLPKIYLLHISRHLADKKGCVSHSGRKAVSESNMTIRG